MKKSIKVNNSINKTIKVNDRVKIIDGSSISYLGNKLPPKDKGYNMDAYLGYSLYIIYSYIDLTGFQMNLQDITSDVLAIGIENRYLSNEDNGYLQDLIIQIGIGYFRISSRHVKQI